MFFAKVLSLFKPLPHTPLETSVTACGMPGRRWEAGGGRAWAIELLSLPRNAQGLSMLSDDFDLPMRKGVASLESIECDDRERGSYGNRLTFSSGHTESRVFRG